MKRLHKLFIIIGVVLVATMLGYQLIVARGSTEIFDAMQYNTFRLGMSQRRARSLFSSRGELVKTSTEITNYGLETTLTFESKEGLGGVSDEKVTLVFADDKLWAFHYRNVTIP